MAKAAKTTTKPAPAPPSRPSAANGKFTKAAGQSEATLHTYSGGKRGNVHSYTGGKRAS